MNITLPFKNVMHYEHGIPRMRKEVVEWMVERGYANGHVYTFRYKTYKYIGLHGSIVFTLSGGPETDALEFKLRFG